MDKTPEDDWASQGVSSFCQCPLVRQPQSSCNEGKICQKTQEENVKDDLPTLYT